jgi:hypothetical protein
MTTLAEIEAAARELPRDEQKQLLNWLAEQMQKGPTAAPHSVLDIAPVSLGKIIQLPQPEDDLLDEMLEQRR